MDLCIPLATSSTYTKLVVVPATRVNYDTVVTKRWREPITSSNASLTVIVPPLFTEAAH